MKKTLSIALLAALTAVPAIAQTAMPADKLGVFKDTSMLKPPAGARIAIIEFEDLECPHCGHAAPIVRAAVEKNHLAYVHHDFPIHQGQWWSLNAAITARYLQDALSPKTAEQFRLDVFAAQNNIVTEEDLARFTSQWFSKHGLQRPFLMDPKYKTEVMADYAVGLKLNLEHTPTIFVVNQHGWIQVEDTALLDAAIAQADKTAGPAAPPAKPVAHKTPAK